MTTEQYILQSITPEDEVLRELVRQTNLTTIHPRMLSGHLQGELLRILTLIVAPKNVLELGTFTGYSAICIARGLSEEAKIHTVDSNDELEHISSTFFQKAGVAKKIIQYYGRALDIIPSMKQKFELIFIDADKREYSQYYESLFKYNLVESGSLILADNVLWYGKVTEKPSPHDTQSQGIISFNRLIAEDTRVDKIILPLRDGLTLIRVK